MSTGTNDTMITDNTYYGLNGSVTATKVSNSAPQNGQLITITPAPDVVVSTDPADGTQTSSTPNPAFSYLSYYWVDLGPATSTYQVTINPSCKTETGSVTLDTTGVQPTASGTIGFTDTNPTPAWTVSNSAGTPTATDANGKAITLTSAQIAAIDADFHITPTSGSTGSGTINWNFTRPRPMTSVSSPEVRQSLCRKP